MTQTWNKETIWVKMREKGQIYTFLTLKNYLLEQFNQIHLCPVA